MRHWLTRSLATLAVGAILTAAGVWVFNQTLGNADYLQRKAKDTGLASGLAAGLPEVVAASTGVSAADQAALSRVLTPTFVENQLLTVLPQLVKHYREGSPMPQFDPAALIAQAAALGITLPPDLAAQLPSSRPVVRPGPADTTLQSAVQQTGQLQWLAPLMAAVLLALIALLAGHHRWLSLAGALATSVISVLVLALLTQLPPRLIASTLDTSPAKPLTAPIRLYTEAIARDQTQMLLWIAGVLGAATVVMVIIHVVVRAMHRFGHAKPKPGAVPPGH